jgi:hypothetical protein
MTRKGIQPSLGRHKRQCSICAHPQRVEIEADFIGWKSPAAIAQEHGLADRSGVYRHALGLLVKRQPNVRAALERITTTNAGPWPADFPSAAIEVGAKSFCPSFTYRMLPVTNSHMPAERGLQVFTYRFTATFVALVLCMAT